MDYEFIDIEVDSGLATLTLNRPAKRNAVNAKLHAELASVFGELSARQDVRVIVLTGAGSAFSAGGDIAYMEELIAEPAARVRAIAEAKAIVLGVLDCPKPIVARVNGDAVGLGATLALFCDVVIADRDAKFADPHVLVAMAAGDGGALIWAQLIGVARAKKYLFTGEALRAEDAAGLGLITEAVTGAELDARVAWWTAFLARKPREAILGTKAAINFSLRHFAEAALETSMAAEARCWTSPDFKEGVSALRERRKPQFS